MAAGSERLVLRNRGYMAIGLATAALGAASVVCSIPLALTDLPLSLLALLIAAGAAGITYFGSGLVRGRVVADVHGVEVRGWGTVRIPWDLIIAFQPPAVGPWTPHDVMPPMAQMVLRTGDSLPLLPVAGWLHPAFWRSGPPKRVCRDLAKLRSQLNRFGHRPYLIGRSVRHRSLRSALVRHRRRTHQTRRRRTTQTRAAAAPHRGLTAHRGRLLADELGCIDREGWHNWADMKAAIGDHLGDPGGSERVLACAAMGMHHGVLAATGTLSGLLAELSRHAGEFAVLPDVVHPYDIRLGAEDSGWRLPGGERDGCAFLLDHTMFLSDSPDMIEAMSATLGTVVGAGAETVSGTYWLHAARDGRLLRMVFVSFAGLTQGMAIGDPLPSEADQPIEGDLDGDGLRAAMACLGVAPRAWLDHGPAQVVTYDGARLPDGGPVQRLRADHAERYGRPDDEWPDMAVLVREPPPDRA